MSNNVNSGLLALDQQVVREYVTVPVSADCAAGLLCSYQPALASKHRPILDTLDVCPRESAHTFLLRSGNKIVRTDTHVLITVIPTQVSRDQLRKAALIEVRRQFPDLADEDTPEFYDMLCNVERELAQIYRESGAVVEYVEEPPA